ncbi:MAG: hypothetical protein IPH80_38500 [Myxococcales bacterium]|nr:hypothetical protein [Myxococcales bacterium]
MTANLRHPAIVPVTRSGAGRAKPFYAMKLVDGRSLDAVIEDAPTLREQLALVPRLIDVAGAIAAPAGRDPPRSQAGQRAGRQLRPRRS